MADKQENQENSTSIQDQTPETAENPVVGEVVAIDEAQVEKAPSNKKSDVKFRVGDRVVVNYKIIEGTKSRVQPYEGIVIGIKGGGVSRTFTVRRMAAANVGVERIFPISSPNIESVIVKAKGKVRRAKLYYLRDRTGKAATKIKER